jgi:hypothetical protein
MKKAIFIKIKNNEVSVFLPFSNARYVNEWGDRMKLEEVLDAWREIVGDFLYQHSRPDSIQRGVLSVRVLQPTVNHVLTMERPRILKRLQSTLKNSGIKDIRLKHG